MRSLGLVTALLALGAAVPSDDFRMEIQDVFNITGRGVVVTGIVEGGPVAVDDVVCLVPAEGETRELTVAGIEMFRQELETAEPGAAVALLFADVERDDVNAGDVLMAACPDGSR